MGYDLFENEWLGGIDLEQTKRVFRCASCGKVFEQEGRDSSIKCPECRGKILILLEGETLGKKGCGGSCGSCSSG